MTPTLQAPPRPPSERRTNGRVPPAPPDFGGGGDGDREPGPRRGLDNLRLAVLVFMGAEAMFFGAMISALFVLLNPFGVPGAVADAIQGVGPSGSAERTP